jgi:hypothetical protein
MTRTLIQPKYSRTKKGLPGKAPHELDLFESKNIFVEESDENKTTIYKKRIKK